MKFNTDMKIYVAGHRGLVGSAIVRNLKSRGFTNLLLRTHSELELLDQSAVARFFSEENPECVFLAAAKVGGIHANNTQSADFIYENLMVQNNILHQAFLVGVNRLIFLGSSCIYPKLAPQPIKEEYMLTGALEPTNSAYAVAKIAGIEMCAAYNRQYATSYLPVMPTNLYGSGDNFNLEFSHVLPALIRKFHLGKLAQDKDWAGIERDAELWGPIPAEVMSGLKDLQGPKVTLWGTGNARREFMHVDDMAAACVFLGLETDNTDLTNIGVGKDMTIKEVAELIRQIVGFTGEVVWDTSKPDGTPRKLLDISQLLSLGYTPRISLREGLQRVYVWYVAQ